MTNLPATRRVPSKSMTWLIVLRNSESPMLFESG